MAVYQLTFEQEQYFLDTCDLYERSRLVTAGTPQDEGWELIASDVPYYHHQTDNIYEHTPVGEGIKPSLMVTDHATFAQGIPLAGNPGVTRAQMFRNTTPNSPLNGWFSVLGPARQIPTLGLFETNEQQVLVRAAEFEPKVDGAVLTAGAITPGAAAFTSIPLTWAAAVDGVGPYLYQPRYRAEGDLDWIDVGGQTTEVTATLTGLTPGTSYQVQVEVEDQLGATDLSEIVTTATGAPLAMGALSVSGFDSTSVSLTWAAATGGAGGYGYQPKYRVQGAGSWTSFGTSLSGTTVTITGLTSNEPYEFEVTVTDAASQTEPSNTVTQSTSKSLADYAGYKLDTNPVLGKVWQDSAGTQPDTTPGQNLGRVQGSAPDAYVVSQAVSGSRPTWQSRTNVGRTFPVMRLDGLDDDLAGSVVSLAQPNTVYTVLFPANGLMNPTGYVLDAGPGLGTNRNAIFIVGESSVHIYANQELIASYALPTTGIVLAAVFNGANSKIYANGTLLATGDAGTASFDLLTIGARYSGSSFYTGDISRVMVYNALHTPTEVGEVSAILGGLYGITVP